MVILIPSRLRPFRSSKVFVTLSVSLFYLREISQLLCRMCDLCFITLIRKGKKTPNWKQSKEVKAITTQVGLRRPKNVNPFVFLTFLDPLNRNSQNNQNNQAVHISVSYGGARFGIGICLPLAHINGFLTLKEIKWLLDLITETFILSFKSFWKLSAMSNQSE